MSDPFPPFHDELLVVCLCAQWCRNCEAYKDTFAQTGAGLADSVPGGARFLWIDIEDEAELVGELDIEDFPSLLLARGTQPLFLGPIAPHAQTLQRLVLRALQEPAFAGLNATDREAANLLQRLHTHPRES